MQLSQPMQDFILHWGEMGGRWGVNRSQAQIHALLHIAEKPLPAEEIAETLGIARSNVSTALKELTSWGIIRIERQLGDRRDHFAAVQDMMELVKKVVAGRHPAEDAEGGPALRAVATDAKDDAATSAYVQTRIAETLDVMEAFDRWYLEIAALPTSTQLTLLKLGARIARFLPKAG